MRCGTEANHTTSTHPTPLIRARFIAAVQGLLAAIANDETVAVAFLSVALLVVETVSQLLELLMNGCFRTQTQRVTGGSTSLTFFFDSSLSFPAA